jgi:hypothetical protein
VTVLVDPDLPANAPADELREIGCATTADIEVAYSHRVLRVRVRDDGRGGADFSHGSGLVGLKDRAESLMPRPSGSPPTAPPLCSGEHHQLLA